MDLLEAVNPSQLSDAAIHGFLSFLYRAPELSEESLAQLGSAGRWGPGLAAFARAVHGAAARCQDSPGRLPMRPTTVLCCVDGSRLSYLALEVAAGMRKHGTLVVLHVAEENDAADGIVGNGVDLPPPDLGVEFIEVWGVAGMVVVVVVVGVVCV